MKIIKKKDTQTSTWAGGTTTELVIYPENANYKLKDFLFRISTATIEVEHSVFTKLEGIKRRLILLDGILTLTHENEHTCTLTPFQFDDFMGDWNTTSVGKATDLNIMMSKQFSCSHKIIYSDKTPIFKCISNAAFSIIYFVKGNGTSSKQNFEKGDVILFNQNEKIDIQLTNKAIIISIHID